MKRTVITSILALSLISQSMAEAIVPIGADQGVKIDKVGNHVTSSIDDGDVTISDANVTLRARKVILDSGTFISEGSNLRIINP